MRPKVDAAKSKRPRRGMITDFRIWTECYATMAAILAAQHPDKAPQLFASYIRTITWASRNFDSSAWASYDMAFHRQAPNRDSLDWGLVDMALYNEAFTGRVRTIVRCSFCLSAAHISVECPYAPVEVKTPEARLSPEGKMSCPPIRQSTQGPRVATVKICRLFNNPAGNQCRFPLCHYAHLCIRCRSPHPAAECSDKQCSGGWARSPPPQLTKS